MTKNMMNCLVFHGFVVLLQRRTLRVLYPARERVGRKIKTIDRMENYNKRGETYFVDGHGLIGTSIEGIIDFWGGGKEGTSLHHDYFKDIMHLVRDSYEEEALVAIQYYIPRTNGEDPIEYRLIKLFDDGECIIFCRHPEFLPAFQYLISREYSYNHEMIKLRRIGDISLFDRDHLVPDFNMQCLLEECKQRDGRIEQLEKQISELQISKEAEINQIEAKLREYEKGEYSSFNEYVTYDNVVKEIAKTDNEQKRGDLVDFFRILLPKMSTSDFMRDIKRKRREIEKEEEEDNAKTVINIQTINNSGTITGDLKDPSYER